ncbi:putative thrombospondin type 1 domain-containing protein [Neospora caninum Liverpool]|uniref:Putative thrombospondin type 1 domain-containing protein n=1 Tax=Neospora caninum (strain Liverpool) TaxID=572307 RepID=F0VA69_NEOCL|nr:putative thrombospondin type 1 domain-containing protein [Neospora caninum Liverpool]CBZ50558.1 putative thrombospondin type 1 domain-containing protein [Neospora caninum Liverpool]CEL65169.1 TPA: thrombospondin type 1 domain-containing protein,putative [Neospora caninum Liverpool]|eukprot:XP_003880591.1 putative thrombospondin type 1 domain-containing protein [Neospora caninum Liverpool]
MDDWGPAGKDSVMDSNPENTASECEHDDDSEDGGAEAEREGSVRARTGTSSTRTRDQNGRESLKSSAGSRHVSAKSSREEDADGEDARASGPDSSETSDGEETRSLHKASVSSPAGANKRSDGAPEPMLAGGRSSGVALSILKKSSTATSRRSSKLSVRFGENLSEEKLKPAGVVAALSSVLHDYRDEPEWTQTDDAAPWNSEAIAENQGASRELREREKESIATIDSTLQSLVISSSGGTKTQASDASGSRNLESFTSMTEPALSELAKKLQKRRLGLTIGVAVTAVALVVALILLATLTAKQKLLIVEKESLVEECKTSAWSEWTACPSLCTSEYSTRRRRITVLGPDPTLCPGLVERRECTGECRAFVIARSTTERLTDHHVEAFPACYGDLRRALETTLGLGTDRCSLTSMRTDLSTGSRFWQLEFVLYPDGNGDADTYEADPNRFPEEVLRKLGAALQGPPTTLSQLITQCMPSDEETNHIATYSAESLEDIAAGRKICSLFAGLAPFGCHCQVTAWSEWTACDKQCSQNTAKRSRSIEYAEAFIDPAVDCPALSEERSCAGGTKIFQVNLPTGVSLGTEAQREAQFEYCAPDLLATLAKTLQLSREALAQTEGWNESLKQWKFSITIDPGVTTVDSAHKELERTLGSATSDLYKALMQCFSLQDAASGQMPTVSLVQSPGGPSSSFWLSSRDARNTDEREDTHLQKYRLSMPTIRAQTEAARRELGLGGFTVHPFSF